jgi:hypothetical protein
MRPRCKFAKTDGSSCGATAQPNGFCWFHDPALAEQREEARKRGGRQPKKRLILPPEAADLPLENVQDVTHALADTANKVRKGELSTPVGHCLSQLFGQLLRAFQGGEMIVTVKPSQMEPPPLTEEVKRRLLEQVRQRHGLPPLPPIGLKELPAPPSPPVGTNGEMSDHARLSPAD